MGSSVTPCPYLFIGCASVLGTPVFFSARKDHIRHIVSIEVDKHAAAETYSVRYKLVISPAQPLRPVLFTEILYNLQILCCHFRRQAFRDGNPGLISENLLYSISGNSRISLHAESISFHAGAIPFHTEGISFHAGAIPFHAEGKAAHVQHQNPHQDN